MKRTVLLLFVYTLTRLLVGGKKRPSERDRAQLRDDLPDLVKDIRPGTPLEDVDRLRTVSDGRLSVETLVSESKWRFREKHPCCLEVDHDRGIVTAVRFAPDQHRSNEVLPFGKAQTVLDNVEGARVYRGRQRRDFDGYTIIEIPTTTPNIVAHLHFFDEYEEYDGGLGWIIYRFDDATFEAEEKRKRDVRIAEERKKPKKTVDKERRRRLAKKMIARSASTRVLSGDFPFTKSELVDMVKHLRPGMPVSALEAVRASSYGIMHAENLKGERVWRKAYDVQQPCVLRYTPDDLIAAVTFMSGVHIPEEFFDPEDEEWLVANSQVFMDAYPKAQRLKELELADRSFRCFEISGESDAFVCIVTFFSDRPFKIEYVTPKVRSAMAMKVQKRYEKQLTLREEAETHPESRKASLNRLGADGVLLKFMRDSAEVSGDSTYTEIAEWLINDATIDDRHMFLNFNWDHGFELPLWIIRQSNTDISSVLKALWATQPESYLKVANERKTAGEREPGQSKSSVATALEFILEINERLEAGFYVPEPGHEPIKYAQKEHIGCLPKEKKDELKQLLPKVAFEDRDGRAEWQLRSTFPDEWGDYIN